MHVHILSAFPHPPKKALPVQLQWGKALLVKRHRACMPDAKNQHPHTFPYKRL